MPEDDLKGSSDISDNIRTTLRDAEKVFRDYAACCPTEITEADAHLFTIIANQCAGVLGDDVDSGGLGLPKSFDPATRVRATAAFREQFPRSKARLGIILQEHRDGRGATIKWDDLRNSQRLDNAFFERVAGKGRTMSLASSEMRARQEKNRDRQPTAEEVAGLEAGTHYMCALCGEVCLKGWSDEEADAEHIRNFGRPTDESDEVICDPCYQEVAAHHGLEQKH